MGWLRDLSDAHTRLKKKIHGTRIPLSPAGIRMMKVVYFTTPIIGGYFVMQWAQNRSVSNLRDLHKPPAQQNPAAFQNDSLKGLLKDIEANEGSGVMTLAGSCPLSTTKQHLLHGDRGQVMEARVDGILDKLRQIFEAKSGYRDDASQAKLLEKHFRYFDSDGSGMITFHEFTAAMVRLNFVGVQAELEGLFDRFDEDLDGTLSYAEFASVVFGLHNTATPTVLSLIDRVKVLILDHGGRNGIRTLLVILRRMDENGDGTIDKEEFHNGLLELGANPRDVEGSDLDKIFRHFDRNGDGRITLDELLRGLRGRMNKRRILLVRQAFDALDSSQDGAVTIDELASRFDTSHHPDVLSGRLRPQDALRQFLAIFEPTTDNTVNWHNFLGYYKDLSAGIDNDDEFELIVRNAWHLTGGEGWCENTTCRRVLVTHSDGRQEICEVQNDLGIGPKDKTKMIRQLFSASAHAAMYRKPTR
ncbi:calcyphosin [Achlya hypogyna]|uniref:Calcyphosin n=1 Tax=Achlya hypogyna TaxID=1202772 RepID=A0A1V9YL34_ACHHY|nr:calcyphosin [Achlya hypogyna]